MRKNSSRRLSHLVLFILTLSFGTAQGVEFQTSETDEPEPRENELSFSYGKLEFDDGSSLGQAAESARLIDKESGGVERLYWENDEDSDWRIYVNGRWLANPDEVDFTLEAFKLEEIFLDMSFRHWVEYDFGAGIYYPPTNGFFTLSDEALEEEVDQFKLTLRFKPTEVLQLKIGYDFFSREGQSLSTAFGDDYQYQISRTISRGVVPALVEGKETVHKVDVAVERKDEADRMGARVHYQRRDVERSRTVERAASQPAANRYTRHEEDNKDDLFGFSGYIRKPLTDNVTGSIGVAYTQLDGDVTGSRVFGANPEADYDIDFANSQLEDRGFLDLDSQRKLKQWIFNGNLVYEPQGSYRWMAGIRFEHLSTEAFGSYLDTYDVVDFGDLERQNQEAEMFSASDKKASDISGFLEFRYKGIPKTLIYSRVEGASQSGDLKEGWTRTELVPNPGSMTSLLDRATDFDRESAFWEVGANYDPFRSLRLSIEGYIKYRNNEYDYGTVDLPEADFTLYPGYIEYQKFHTEDINARAHWKIFKSLKSVTRVDLQTSTIESKDYLHEEMETSTRERMVFNQSLTWTPHPRFFITGTYNLVDDLTETPAADLEGTFSGIIVNIPNDYWQADVSLYYVVSSLIDVQIGYNYMEVDNYIDNSPKTVPYGSEIEQHHGSANVFFHFTPNLGARIGYHYYEQTDLASAGNRDYSVHVVNGSVQMVF